MNSQLRDYSTVGKNPTWVNTISAMKNKITSNKGKNNKLGLGMNIKSSFFNYF